MMALPIIFIILFGSLIVFGSVFWLWMLVDCAMNPTLTDMEKVVWVLIVLFTHLVGAVLYFFVRRGRGARA